jgi:aldehyde:ferredoxin oxidoreductase
MHDPRFAPGLARTYAFDPTPARHVKSGFGLTQLGMGPEKYDFEGTGPGELQNIAFTEIINSAG